MFVRVTNVDKSGGSSLSRIVCEFHCVAATNQIRIFGFLNIADATNGRDYSSSLGTCSRQVLRQSPNKMKKVLLTYSIVLIGLQVRAQENPVKWTFDSKKTAAGAYEIRLNATVAAPWHMYSQHTPKGGPLPTKIQFKANPLVTRSGSVLEEGQIKKVYDKNYEVDVVYFAGDAKFLQTVKLKTAVKTKVQGSVEYMVCNDEKCLQPVTVPFDIVLN
jgi:hypothetical protein